MADGAALILTSKRRELVMRGQMMGEAEGVTAALLSAWVLGPGASAGRWQAGVQARKLLGMPYIHACVINAC